MFNNENYKMLILNFFKQNKFRSFSLLFLISLIYPIESLVIPKILANLLNSIRSTDVIPMFKNYGKNTYEIFIILLIFIITTTLLDGLIDLLSAWFNNSYSSYIRKLLIKRTIEKTSENFKELKSTKTLFRVFETSQNLNNLFRFIILDIIPILITLTVICIYLNFIDKHIGMIIIIVTIMLFIIPVLSVSPIIKRSSEREGIYISIVEKLNEKFQNLFNIHVNNQSKGEIKDVNKIDNKYVSAYDKQLKLQVKINSLMKLLLMIAFLSIIYICYVKNQNDKLSSVNFITVILMLTYYNSSMNSILKDVPKLSIVYGSLKLNENYIKSVLQDNNLKNNGSKFNSGNIEFKKVFFKYPNTDSYVHRNLDFRIKAGSCTTILGKSGSGKTSIAKMLLKINKIEKGDILIDGTNINNITAEYLRKNINYINQKTNLFNDAVIYNMAYGNNVSYDKIVNILKKYELLDLFAALEKGVYTSAGVNGASLSLGMQKITIIIRGILRKSIIYIFDEPLAGLDIETRKKTMFMIKDLCKDKTIIIITHDMEITQFCTNIIDMNRIKKTEYFSN